jgi:hypothetical protein
MSFPSPPPLVYIPETKNHVQTIAIIIVVLVIIIAAIILYLRIFHPCVFTQTCSNGSINA